MQNVGWLASSKIVGAVLSIFYLAIVARVLGPAGFGVFSLILSFGQFISTLLKFETWQSLVKFGQAPLQAKDNDTLAALLSLAIGIDLIVSIAGALFAAILVYTVPFIFDIPQEIQSSALAYTLVLIFAFRSTPMGLLRLYDRFDAGAVAESITPIVRMIGALWAMLFQPDLNGFLIAWACSEILCALSYWLLALRHCRPVFSSISLKKIMQTGRQFPEFLKFSLGAYLTCILAVSGSQAPTLLVGIFVGDVEAGLFRMGQQLSNALGKISGLFSRALFTEMARSYERLEGAARLNALKQIMRSTVAVGLSVTSVIFGLVYFAGENLIGLIFGQDYLPAYSLLAIMCVATCIDIMGVGFEPIIQVANRIGRANKGRILLLILSLASMSILLNIYGVIGGAYAALLNAIIGFALFAIMARSALRVSGR